MADLSKERAKAEAETHRGKRLYEIHGRSSCAPERSVTTSAETSPTIPKTECSAGTGHEAQRGGAVGDIAAFLGPDGFIQRLEITVYYKEGTKEEESFDGGMIYDAATMRKRLGELLELVEPESTASGG